MNRKKDTVFCYYAHNSVWTCELGYGADTMFHRTYFLFQILPTHMTNSKIIPAGKRRFDGVLYNLWRLLTPWFAASRLLASPAWLKLKGMAGHWLVYHTAPVRAKPDGRPRLEWARYRYPTSCSLPTYLSSTLQVTHMPRIPLWGQISAEVQSRLDLCPQ